MSCVARQIPEDSRFDVVVCFFFATQKKNTNKKPASPKLVGFLVKASLWEIRSADLRGAHTFKRSAALVMVTHDQVLDISMTATKFRLF